MLDNATELVKMSKRVDELVEQVSRLESLLARGFSHMNESADPMCRLASNQVTGTVKGWNRERKANANSR